MNDKCTSRGRHCEFWKIYVKQTGVSQFFVSQCPYLDTMAQAHSECTTQRVQFVTQNASSVVTCRSNIDAKPIDALKTYVNKREDVLLWEQEAVPVSNVSQPPSRELAQVSNLFSLEGWSVKCNKSLQYSSGYSLNDINTIVWNLLVWKRLWNTLLYICLSMSEKNGSSGGPSYLNIYILIPCIVSTAEWCNTGRVICYHVCVTMHVKDHLS